MLFTIAVLSMLSSVAASVVAPAEQGAVAAMNAPRQLEPVLEVSGEPCADVYSKKKCEKFKNKGMCVYSKKNCEKTCGVCTAPDPMAILQLELDEAQAKVLSQAKLLKDSQAELAVCQAKLE